MLGRFGHWALDGLVLFFALYAFVFVPLGAKSGYEHLRAILDTDAASHAGDELVTAGERLRHKILGTEPISGRGRPELPEFGSGGDDDGEEKPRPRKRDRRPRDPSQMAVAEREADGFTP